METEALARARYKEFNESITQTRVAELQLLAITDRDKYSSTPEWKQRRVLRNWKGHCEDCLEPMDPFHAHHISYDRFGNEDFDDLVILCSDCHTKRHSLEKGLNHHAFKKQQTQAERDEEARRSLVIAFR